MPTWIIVAVIGYLLQSLVFVIDKVLLTNAIKNSNVYTFFIGVLGLAVFAAAPWGLTLMGARSLLLNLLIGASFMLALVFFFRALAIGEASRVVPFIGGLIPLATFACSALLLGERLRGSSLGAFVLLLIGTVLLTLQRTHKRTYQRRAFVWGLLAALAFAGSFVATKFIYLNEPFLSSFIWQRLGAFLFVLLLLFAPRTRHDIATTFAALRSRVGAIFLGNQALGAAGYVFTNYAIALASVTLVNALQGVQYAFLVIFALIGSLRYPKLLKENFTPLLLTLKIIAIFFVSGGLYVLSVSGT